MRKTATTSALLLFAGCAIAPGANDPATRRGYYHDTAAAMKPPIENTFIGEEASDAPLPPPEAWRLDVPTVEWKGHDDAAEAFSAAWRMVGEKIRGPEPGTNFKRNFVYTPFGNSVFVWGSCFITMYGKYAADVFPFIEQLDNFYAVQMRNGFIPRQLGIFDGRSQFAPDDPSSVGGVIFAWAELQWFRMHGDLARLRRVYPVLLAHHRWYAKHRTWKDGTYFSSGWGCGMDNIVRIESPDYTPAFEHGHLSFVDVTLQQIFDGKCLVEMARLLELDPPVDVVAEIDALTRIANERMWDPQAGVYKDLDRHGNRVKCEHIGGFWAFLAGVADESRRSAMIASLEDESRFAAPCGTRSTAKGSPGYESDGGNYWRGGVWAITDYAIVKGLDACGEREAAARLALRQVEAFAKVFRDTGTIWESYDPEKVAPGKLYGNPVRRDFVGFSGVAPISLLLEDVFGIEMAGGELTVNPRTTDAFAVRNLGVPGLGKVDILVSARGSLSEKPDVRITRRSAAATP